MSAVKAFQRDAGSALVLGRAEKREFRRGSERDGMGWDGMGWDGMG